MGLTLNQTLENLGYTTHAGPHQGQKTILSADSFVLFVGRAHEVWEWLRTTHDGFSRERPEPDPGLTVEREERNDP